MKIYIYINTINKSKWNTKKCSSNQAEDRKDQ